MKFGLLHLLVFVFAFLFQETISAQMLEQPHRCGTPKYYSDLFQANPKV
jgi:hypothetical protein